MKGIILAAGVGSRIRPLTDNTPKSLLNIGDKPILQRMIENLQGVGITEIAIVTGYLEEQIKDFVTKTFSQLSVTYIRNEKYAETNTGYSLLLTQDFARGDSFVKFDADVVFEQAILERLVNSPYETGLCIDKNIHLDKEEVKVITDGEDHVLEVGKKLDPHKSRGESIGIEKIGKDAGVLLYDELSRLLQDPANYNEYYDDSYTTLVAKGIPFYAIDITGLKWVEIDTHEDYQRATELFTK